MSTVNPNPRGPEPDRASDAAWGCGWAWLWAWLFVILVLFAGWGWGGWYGGWGGPYGWWPARPAAPPPQGALPPAGQPAQPTGADAEFLGRSLTVSGQVDQVLSPQAFTLAGARDLLVINKDGKAPAVKKGETVHVTGKVERFNADAIHKETGVDQSKVPAADFAGRAAVVASSVSAKPAGG